MLPNVAAVGAANLGSAEGGRKLTVGTTSKVRKDVNAGRGKQQMKGA